MLGNVKWNIKQEFPHVHIASLLIFKGESFNNNKDLNHLEKVLIVGIFFVHL